MSGRCSSAARLACSLAPSVGLQIHKASFGGYFQWQLNSFPAPSFLMLVPLRASPSSVPPTLALRSVLLQCRSGGSPTLAVPLADFSLVYACIIPHPLLEGGGGPVGLC